MASLRLEGPIGWWYYRICNKHQTKAHQQGFGLLTSSRLKAIEEIADRHNPERPSTRGRLHGTICMLQHARPRGGSHEGVLDGTGSEKVQEQSSGRLAAKAEISCQHRKDRLCPLQPMAETCRAAWSASSAGRQLRAFQHLTARHGRLRQGGQRTQRAWPGRDPDPRS